MQHFSPCGDLCVTHNSIARVFGGVSLGVAPVGDHGSIQSERDVSVKKRKGRPRDRSTAAPSDVGGAGEAGDENSAAVENAADFAAVRAQNSCMP